MSESVHEDIRNLIAMILLPKKLHENDQSQAAYLRAAVSRVSFNQRKDFEKCFIFQIANPTILENQGALMLAPIYHLLFQEDRDSFNLALTHDQIAVCYRTYKTDDLTVLQNLRV